MFSYYIHWVVMASEITRVILENHDFYIDAISIQHALTEFWDYVNPFSERFYIEITYMAKEILPDTYNNPKYKFNNGGKKDV